MTSPASHSTQKLHLRLYTGTQPFDRKASLGQLHDVLSAVPGSYNLEVLDGQQFRDLAAQDQVVLTPTLVRISPLPVVRLTMPQGSSAALRTALNS